jgi:hypothetical protein
MHEEGEEALKSQVRLLRCLVRLTRQTHIVRRAKTDLRTLAATIKARWICEQAHQQLNEELGLDHFEGRSWRPSPSCAHDNDRLRFPPVSPA